MTRRSILVRLIGVGLVLWSVLSGVRVVVAFARGAQWRGAGVNHFAAVERALGPVLDDLHRTTEMRPTVLLASVDAGVWLRFDSQLPGVPIPYDAEDDAMLRAVADEIQDQVMADHATVWPTCPVHASGLHPELLQSRAPVWQCRAGSHAVAPIGQLGIE